MTHHHDLDGLDPEHIRLRSAGFRGRADELRATSTDPLDRDEADRLEERATRWDAHAGALEAGTPTVGSDPQTNLAECILEILAARREGRVPASWAVRGPQAAPAAAPRTPAPAPAEPAGPQMSVALPAVEQMRRARREGR